MARHTVLVVEDEVLVRMHLTEMLQDAGYLTLEASSAAEALAILEKHREIRVVFTDIQMPGTMDGIALARYVRKRWPPTIIVVSSGKTRPKAGELPDDMDFLAKPYEAQSLNRIMSDVAERLS
jgi:CheY-like chemotaxis protein